LICTTLLSAATCTLASVGNSTDNATSTGKSIAELLRSSGPKVVKVCTTGDYPPLTSYNPITKEYSGLAPTVLKHFGPVYNYKIEFVRTTWATLNEDLESGSKCALAAGGITETRDRSAQFGVSIPLLTNKKVPIFSKENEGLFKSFTDIDQAGVTVLENEGGTNEAFMKALRAKGMLSKPNVHVLSSSEATLACLAKYPKLPLVMFTDAIETQFRTAMPGTVLSDAGVSFVMPPDLNPVSYKVYLAAKSNEGTTLLKDLDRFLRGARATGLFEAWRREAFADKYIIPVANCSLELTLV